MNKFFLLLLLSVIGIQSVAQVEPDNFHFNFSKEKLEVGETVDVVITVDDVADWYIYSMYYDCDPIKTEFVFEEDPSFELVGKAEVLSKEKEVDSEDFGCIYKKMVGSAKFGQTIKVLQPTVKVSGTFTYMTCKEGPSGVCIPYFDNPFELPVLKVAQKKNDPVIESPQNRSDNPALIEDSKASSAGKVDEPEKTEDTLSSGQDQLVSNGDSVENTTVRKLKSAAGGCEIQRRPGHDHIVIERYEKQDIAGNDQLDFISLLIFAGVAFLFGLTALLTPCVFPMIPMTVSFFTGTKKTRKKMVWHAVFYGLSIIVIYTILGVIVAKINGPEFANYLATSWVPNVIFFVVFVIFAISFFGMFDIVLPSSLINKMDEKADKGGLIGIFFMAFTLVLVSFSCTGPIVGTILMESAGGDWLKPIFGMFGFSLAFSIPFALFAIFPSWLSNLPKSGGWLNSVKVVLGFIELALAFKFLSMADLAYHWNLLDREAFLAIWIAIFGLMGLYLIGKITLPHDSNNERISVPRLILAIIAFSFTMYMVPGMWGAPLKFLSGILPPSSTQDFDLYTSQFEKADNLCDKPMYGENLELPHNLEGYFDLHQAICCAIEQDKPIFIDFTGHGCVNCRKMEQQVWSHGAVHSRLNTDYVMLAMYVDDRTLPLPDGETYIDENGKEIDLLGEFSMDFEKDKFGVPSQPYYVLLGYDREASEETGKVVLQELQPPKAYDTNIPSFLDFLTKGLKNYDRIGEK